jgi:hypothetical protein
LGRRHTKVRNGRTTEPEMTPEEEKAVARVRRAGVNAPTRPILCWVRGVGTTTVMASKYSDIRAVANAF